MILLRRRSLPGCSFTRIRGILVAVWGDDFAAVGGDEGIRKLDAILEANVDKRLEAAVGPMKDTQGKIVNRIIAYSAERKSFEWHTDGKRAKNWRLYTSDSADDRV